LFIFKAFLAEVKYKAALAEMPLIPYRSLGRKLKNGRTVKMEKA